MAAAPMTSSDSFVEAARMTAPSPTCAEAGSLLAPGRAALAVAGLSFVKLMKKEAGAGAAAAAITPSPPSGKLQIFISWSGDLSQAVGSLLYKWLRRVIQDGDP